MRRKVNVAISPFSLKRLACWRSWLRAEEVQRVSKYHKQSDQGLFVARRGLARTTIGQMLNIQPSSVRFATESTGKLRWLSDDWAHRSCEPHVPLDFNLTKALGVVAMAAYESERVGVDIETIGSLPELELLATQNLHPIELNVWHQIPQRDRTHAYYHLWVVKEAFVKALGLGLSQHPNSILSEQALLGLD